MAGDLYDQDFIGWTEQQARKLREAAGQRVNLPLDWEHGAEEIEGLGNSEVRSVTSQITRDRRILAYGAAGHLHVISC